LTYYRQNAFKIESPGKRILIDPGRSLSSFRSLIPKKEWQGTNIILVTHRDPDHFALVPRIASRYGCDVVCGVGLKLLMEEKGVEGVHFLAPGERIGVEGLEVLGIPAVHGPGKEMQANDVGSDRKGCIGFSVRIEDKDVVNLGDTLFVEAWEDVEADILMLPIGGYFTMNRKEAARAAKLIKPNVVIPTHYHWKIGPYVHPARVKKFAREMSAEGMRCVVLRKGESVEV
jgi:L-ascorbate metabolism protein UlaG (beta-lactamase superfamily)